MAAAPEPPNGRIPNIYRYFQTKCRHNVEFMGFPNGIRLWRMLFGDPRRPRLSRQMDEFLIFIAIFDQNAAKMSSLWRSAPAKPRKHVGHGARAKRKQWVNIGG